MNLARRQFGHRQQAARPAKASESQQCANDSKSSGLGTVLLGIVAIALAGMVGTIGLLQQVGELGPKVGDIVAFDPLESISRDMHARLDRHAGQPPARRRLCAGRPDHPRQRRQRGHRGARTGDAGFGYRVHWAGVRSSDDGANCGVSADLLMSLEDIEVLAMAAGGYGVPAGKQAGISSLRRSSAASAVTANCRSGDIDAPARVSAT